MHTRTRGRSAHHQESVSALDVRVRGEDYAQPLLQFVPDLTVSGGDLVSLAPRRECHTRAIAIRLDALLKIAHHRLVAVWDGVEIALGVKARKQAAQMVLGEVFLAFRKALFDFLLVAVDFRPARIFGIYIGLLFQ